MEKQQCLFNEACENGDMDIIDSILAKGFDVNFSYNGVHPLEAAMQSNSWTIDLLTKLIIHGANVDLDNYLGWNAMDHCLYSTSFQPHIASLLLDCSKLGINRLDNQGRSYLWTAATVEACKFLIDNGIDINHDSNDNLTCLDIIEEPKITNYLRSQGAKIYAEL